MPAQTPPRHPRALRLWRTLLPAVLSLALLAPVSAVTAPVASEAAVRAFGRQIEWFAPVQLQRRCDPRPKPGTVKLATWLQQRYRSSGSLGISRACRAGGTSEHKEGRAFDWKVNVGNSRQRNQAAAFLRLLLAKDEYGTRPRWPAAWASCTSSGTSGSGRRATRARGGPTAAPAPTPTTCTSR